MILLGLLNARLVRRIPVHRLLVLGLGSSTVAAVILVVVVADGLSVLAVLPPLFLRGGQPWPDLGQRDGARSEAGTRQPGRRLRCSAHACSAGGSWCPRSWLLVVKELRFQWRR